MYQSMYLFWSICIYSWHFLAMQHLSFHSYLCLLAQLTTYRIYCIRSFDVAALQPAVTYIIWLETEIWNGHKPTLIFTYGKATHTHILRFTFCVGDMGVNNWNVRSLHTSKSKYIVDHRFQMKVSIIQRPQKEKHTHTHILLNIATDLSCALSSQQPFGDPSAHSMQLESPRHGHHATFFVWNDGNPSAHTN